MKKSARLVCLLTLVLGVGMACAAEKTQEQTAPTKTKAKTSTPVKYPRGVALNGSITDGPYQLIIITDRSMRNRGQSTVGQVIGAYGARR